MKFEIDTFFGKVKAFFYALFIEHSFLNLIWKNFHRIEDGVYRSAQMNPITLKKSIKKYGLKEILSFRMSSKKSPLSLFEEKICEEMVVKFQHISLQSRVIPKKEKLIELKNYFKNMEKPFLMHCKAGADRTSLAAILYLYFKGEDLKKAMDSQLGFWKYGHIKNSDAGIIDFYFQKFMESGEKDLIEWTDKNREKIMEEFKNRPKGFLNFINNVILKRE